ncbi:MAG: leucine-rich repeat domain-containing protein [Clostridia bacterium]|nr:leucine-rich repeat domain-containing protein [Clostridia bacterium]
MKQNATKWIIIMLSVLLAAILAMAGFLAWRYRRDVRLAVEAAARAADPYIRPDGIYDLKNADLSDARLFDIADARSVDLSGREIDPGAIEAICGKNPGAEILWDVPFAGERIPNTAETLYISDFGAETKKALGYFTKLRTLNAVAVPEYRAVMEYAETHPELEVVYGVPLFGKTVLSTEQWLDLTGVGAADFDADELLEALEALPGVTDVDLVGMELDDATKLALKAAHPGIRWYWFVNAGGKRFESTAKKLDFTDCDFASFDAFLDVVRLMNTPEYVDVATQGFESVQMEKACAEFPDTVFAWTLRIGKYFVRTDAQVIDLGYESGDRALRNADIVPLKYCSRLEALSLNNQSISDLTPLAGLTKLRVLCLGANKISDLRPLANLKKLQYLNLTSNKVCDLAPLAGLSELTDLNVMDNDVTDLSPLFGMKKMRHLYVGGNDGLTPGASDRAAEALGANAQVNASAKGNWKNNPVRDTVDDIFVSRSMRTLYPEG